jgi:hypothetical protein
MIPARTAADASPRCFTELRNDELLAARVRVKVCTWPWLSSHKRETSKF